MVHFFYSSNHIPSVAIPAVSNAQKNKSKNLIQGVKQARDFLCGILGKYKDSFDTKVLKDQGRRGLFYTGGPISRPICGIFHEYKDVLQGADWSAGGAL